MGIPTPTVHVDAKDEAAYALYSTGGGARRPVPWLRDNIDTVVGWSSDGASLLVSEYQGTALTLARVELATGTREVLRTLRPANPVGTVNIRSLVVAADPNVYAYQVGRQLSRIFLIRGAR